MLNFTFTILSMSEHEQKTILSAMRSCKFFETLDDDTLRLLRPTAKRVKQPRNTVIFHEGEPCHGFYIVESGAVKIYKESTDAKEHVLHVAVDGDCFGEAALFLGKGYPASAAAVQDSELILLRKNEFLQLLLENPKVSLRLMASMATWTHRLVESIEALTLKDASARFAKFLLAKVKINDNDGVIVNLGMPKQVLASHLGMSGETLSRLIAKFEADGLIIATGRRVTLLSIDGLREMREFGAS